MSTSEVIAEKNCETNTPVSTTLEGFEIRPPPINTKTMAKAAIAPANAPIERVTAPDPKPRIITDTAPVDAPDDTPSRYGSASGLRVIDCNTAPEIARPNPTVAASKTRGKRDSQTRASMSGGAGGTGASTS